MVVNIMFPGDRFLFGLIYLGVYVLLNDIATCRSAFSYTSIPKGVKVGGSLLVIVGSNIQSS